MRPMGILSFQRDQSTYVRTIWGLVLKFPSLILLVVCMGLPACRVQLRVYPPHPATGIPREVPDFPKVQVEFREDSEIQALLVHDFQETKQLPNEYGGWVATIQRELAIRGQSYPALLEEGGKIQIQEFQLESRDTCTKHQTKVILKAEFQIGKRPSFPFEKSDTLENRVSNCIFVASSVTLVPLLWYVPYLGFQGNREDQLNQLGRNALKNFFEALERASGPSPKAKP